MKISAKLLIGFGVIVAVLIGIFGISSIALNELRDEGQKITQDLEQTRQHSGVNLEANQFENVVVTAIRNLLQLGYISSTQEQKVLEQNVQQALSDASKQLQALPNSSKLSALLDRLQVAAQEEFALKSKEISAAKMVEFTQKTRVPKQRAQLDDALSRKNQVLLGDPAAFEQAKQAVQDAKQGYLQAPTQQEGMDAALEEAIQSLSLKNVEALWESLSDVITVDFKLDLQFFTRDLLSGLEDVGAIQARSDFLLKNLTENFNSFQSRQSRSRALPTEESYWEWIHFLTVTRYLDALVQLAQTVNERSLPPSRMTDTVASLDTLNEELQGLKAQSLALVNNEIRQVIAEMEATLSDLTAQTRMQINAALDNVDDSASSMVDLLRSTNLQILGFILGTVLVSVVVYFVIQRSVRKPIRTLIAKVRSMAQLDLSVSFDASRRDEVGQVERELQGIESAFKATLLQIREASGELGSWADGLTEQAGTSTENSRALEERTENASQSIQNVSASVEEVTSSVQSVAQAAQNVTDIARKLSGESREASAQAHQGDARVQQMVEISQQTLQKTREEQQNVTRLSQRAADISQIAGTISSIAEQTNLLALNAAIEAARAGEAGKGFAVVADEIRKLAEESQRATGEIAGNLGEIEQGVEQVARSTGNTLDSVSKLNQQALQVKEQFGEISRRSNSISELAQHLEESALDQSSQTDEMASALEISAASLSEVAGQVESMSSSSAQQLQASEKVLQASQKLAQLSEQLSQEIARFRV